jgi:hypothetical protein
MGKKVVTKLNDRDNQRFIILAVEAPISKYPDRFNSHKVVSMMTAVVVKATTYGFAIDK